MHKINDIPYLAAVAIGVVIGGIYFYLGIYLNNDSEKKMKVIQVQINKAVSSLAAKKESANKEEEIRNLLENTQSTFSSIDTYFPPNQTFDSLSDVVREELERFLITEVSRTPIRDGVTSHEFYQVLPVNFVVESNYVNLMSFLYTISNHDNVIIPDSLSFIKLPESDSLRAEIIFKGYKLLSTGKEKQDVNKT